ncbi:Hypothetical protein PHPALM_1836 [Phytophthora palmivora]|uniref:Tc1-like transposase DDE domain-containing protein n=1 Tax=Phytophthora palmivora TaxID=4796 RepID=A0A2P4YRB1_9STRA|nr:Hypothetical protein PHPALM_1836 [Phytophthora palmivora]
MDGASYHKNQTNKSPTMNWSRLKMLEWLRSRGVQCGEKDTKKAMMILAMPLKEKPKYKAQTIASNHGHFLLFTPPYHPELQPIELIWAIVKGRIAEDPPENGGDALAKVNAGLRAITRQEWIDVYRHSQGFENMYQEHKREADEMLLMSKEDRIPV